MKAPSFRCTERPEDGALILHYYSDRPGLEHIVIGIVKVLISLILQKLQIYIVTQTVASKLHGTEVEVKILKTKADCDHVQFLITETGPGKQQQPEIDEIVTLSLGKLSIKLM